MQLHGKEIFYYWGFANHRAVGGQRAFSLLSPLPLPGMALLGSCPNHPGLRWLAASSPGARHSVSLEIVFWFVSDRVSLCSQAGLTDDFLPLVATPICDHWHAPPCLAPLGKQLGREEGKSRNHRDAVTLQKVLRSPPGDPTVTASPSLSLSNSDFRRPE